MISVVTSPSRAPAAIVGAVAAHGLPGAPEVGPALDDRAWRALLDLATTDRLTPLLAHAVASGALVASARQREQVATAHEQSMRLCLLLERSLLATASSLDAAGIACRVLKGPAVAHLDYPDPSWRAFGDVDVLVSSRDYDAAIATLAVNGAHRRFTEVRPGFDRRWGKGACMVAPDGTQIDVHRTFVAGPFGLSVDLAELLARTERVTIGGRPLDALDRPGRFLHACFHAALGDRVARLATLRDVAQLILVTDLDQATVLERAERWRADAVVARAVRITWARLGLPPDPWSEWAAQHRADRFQARSLRAYTTDARSYAAQVVAGLAAVRTVPEKVAYMRALLVADPHHLAARDGSYRRRVQRAWHAFGATRGPR